MVRSEDPKKINDAASQQIIVNTNANNSLSLSLSPEINSVLALHFPLSGQDEDAVLTL